MDQECFEQKEGRKGVKDVEGARGRVDGGDRNWGGQPKRRRYRGMATVASDGR